MKKLTLILSLVLCAVILTGCMGDSLNIEDKEWKLVSASFENADLGSVPTPAFGEVTLSATSGNIVIIDKETGESYTGTYIQTNSNSQGRDYSFTIGEYSGYGILSRTDFYSDEKLPTISLSLTKGAERYTLCFQSEP